MSNTQATLTAEDKNPHINRSMCTVLVSYSTAQISQKVLYTTYSLLTIHPAPARILLPPYYIVSEVLFVSSCSFFS